MLEYRHWRKYLAVLEIYDYLTEVGEEKGCPK